MERINHPEHYGGDTTYEVIKVLEAWGLDKDFCLGNSVKYIARAGKKNNLALEDLLKAQWYLNRRIERLKETTFPGKIWVAPGVPVEYPTTIFVQPPLCPICRSPLVEEFGELQCANGHPPYKFVT